MTSYQINDLERLTGIKAHTIRIWEKRYGIIKPERTATNRRNYNDDQLRRLLNVTTLLASGHKISTVAALTDEEINKYIQQGNENEHKDSIIAGFINDLIKTMIVFDEVGFEKIFSTSILRFGVYETMVRVVYPFLHKTGVLWSVNKSAPIEEHFATCIIKKKLYAALDGLLPSNETENKFVLFLPQGEWHEIGLLFANYILRSHGQPTIFLGQNVPDNNVKRIFDQIKPEYLLCFFIAHRSKEDVLKHLRFYCQLNSEIKLLVAGNPDLLPDAETLHPQVTYLTGVKHLEDFINLISVNSGK